MNPTKFVTKLIALIELRQLYLKRKGNPLFCLIHGIPYVFETTVNGHYLVPK